MNVSTFSCIDWWRLREEGLIDGIHKEWPSPYDLCLDWQSRLCMYVCVFYTWEDLFLFCILKKSVTRPLCIANIGWVYVQQHCNHVLPFCSYFLVTSSTTSSISCGDRIAHYSIEMLIRQLQLLCSLSVVLVKGFISSATLYFRGCLWPLLTSSALLICILFVYRVMHIKVTTCFIESCKVES